MSNPDGAFTHDDGESREARSVWSPTSEDQESDPPAHAEGGSTTSAEPAGDAEGADREQLPLDLIFEVLKNERRRLVVEHLEERGGPMTIGELADRIAAHENDTTVDGITSQERKRVYVGLYQAHLPKMDGLDIVQYDRRRGVVDLADNAEQLAPYRNHSPSPRRRWYRYYAAITGGGAVLLAAAATGLGPIQPTVPLALAVVLAALVGCSLAHAYAVGIASD